MGVNSVSEKNKPKKNKHLYKLPPCPAYDIEGMQSWLSDMAKDGLLLSKYGFFAGFAIFEKTEPCTIKYRLEVAPKTSVWADNDGEPDEDTLEVNELYGWEYVAYRGQFYIYRSKELEARELNTDSKVQVMAINKVRSRERNSVVFYLLWIIFYLYMNNCLITMLNQGTWFALYSMLLIIFIIVGALKRFIHLGKLRRKLLEGVKLNHHKAWKRRALNYRIGKLLFPVLIILWFGILFHKGYNSLTDVGKMPLANYGEDPPFATIADFEPKGEYEQKDFAGFNKVQQWSDWLAPVAIKWDEEASVKLPDGRELSGFLNVDYYETLAPWLAREVAREFLHKDRRYKRYEKIALPELEVDYAVAYMSPFPTLVIQNGNKVIRVSFSHNQSQYELSLGELAKLMANSIN